MSYSEAINYLYNLQKYGIKFGLDNIRRLTAALDNPQRSFLSVHVAGTNGKGSTSAIIASVLKASGLRVGLFTSPHMVSFTERISVDGEEITEDEIIGLAEEIREKISSFGKLGMHSEPVAIEPVELSPTFFEVVTAMAFLYFRRKKIDIAVTEVGMGGRLDATNIITPEVSVITNISYDHKEFLGSTLKEIAHEKAGIIKRGVPVVASCQEPEAMEVIEKKAAEKKVELYVYGRDFFSQLKRKDISEICFDYRSGDSFTINNLVLPLTGEHQMQNASVAIKAAMLVLKRMGNEEWGMDQISELRTPNFIREGLKTVRWLGRLEIVKEDPPILMDGAHNPAAAVALSKALKKIFLKKYKRIIIILGIMGDKDIRGIMEPLFPLASEIILTFPQYSRAASPEKLAGIAASLGFFDVRVAPTVKDAIEMAENSCKLQVASYKSEVKSEEINLQTLHSALSTQHSALIVITGSFYTIGEAKEVLGEKGVFAKLRE